MGSKRPTEAIWLFNAVMLPGRAMESPESNAGAKGCWPGGLTSVKQLYTLESVEDAASAVFHRMSTSPQAKWLANYCGTDLHRQFHALKPRYKRSVSSREVYKEWVFQ